MDERLVYEMLFAILPVVIIGFLFLIWGLKAKKAYKEKRKTAVKAKVTNIKIEEIRTNDNYLRDYKYTLELSYSYNGVNVVTNYNSMYAYEVNSIIDLDIKNGNIRCILTPPAKDVLDNYNRVSLKGNVVLLGISYFLLSISGLAVLVNYIQSLGKKYEFLECLLILIGIFLVYFFVNKKRNKMKDKYNLITSGGYSSYIGKIIDLKKDITNNERRRATVSYFPVIEYSDGFSIKRRVDYRGVGKDSVGQNLVIYKDRTTGDIISENGVNWLNVEITLLKYVNIGLLVISIFIIISYL